MIERPRPLRAALLSLALAGAPGCAKWFLETPAPVETPPPESTAPAPTQFGCSRRAGRLAKPPPVTLEQLRAAVDTDSHAEPTAALLARLGPARHLEGRLSSRHKRIAFDSFAIAVEQHEVAGATRIRSVELEGGKSLPAYAGPLPEGLSFQMNVEETFRVLGPPDEKVLLTHAMEPHHYRARGLAVRFDDGGCLDAVSFVLPIPARGVRFDDVTAQPHKARSGLDGVAVEFTRALGELPGPSTALRVFVELADERGQPVRELGADGTPGGPFSAQMADLPRGELRRALHVPFSALVLPPGRHTLRGTLRAQATIEGAAVDLAPVASPSFDVALDMPRLVRARIGVRSVEVEPGEYDVGSPKPELAWTMTRESERAGMAYLSTFTSKTRQDTLTGTWTELSSPFIAAPQDQVVFCIIDQDIALADEIGCFGMTLERYQADAKARTPLAKGKVRRLELATPKLQPIR